MIEKICISCKRKIVNDKGSVTFMCPQCDNYELTRCKNCRSNAVKFTCPSCGFVGPN